MSIARMLHADLVCDAGAGADLVSRLERAGILQVIDLHQSLPDELGAIERRPALEAPVLDEELQKVRQVLETFDRFLPVKKGMLQGFFGSPPFVTEQQLHELAERLDVDRYAPELQRRADEHDRTVAELETARELQARLAPWEALDLALASLASARHSSIVTVQATHAQHEILSALVRESGAGGDFAWQEAGHDDRTLWGGWATLSDRRADLEAWIRQAGVSPVHLPDIAETPRAALARLAAEIGNLEQRRDALAAGLAADAAEKRPLAQALFDELANSRKNVRVPGNFFSTATVTVARGWVLERESDRLEKLAAGAGADLVLREPLKDEAPPVFLVNRRLLRPYQILLEMFGLPSYTGFDPTAFVGAAMTLFYAICFGDVGYGIVQMLLALFLIRKYKPAAGTRLFLDLFVQLGIGAACFGLLTWSFFGTSPGYKPGGPKILGFLPLISPTNDFLLIIGLGLAVGIIVQMASIGAGLVNALKHGDVKAAAFDFGAWLVMLFGLQLWAATKFLPGLPAAVSTAGLAIMGLGILVIVAFAGRDAKTIGGRLATGIISLYGIVGAYGIVSYFSDVLSFSRLAILNLTSGFIAMVGNLLGSIVTSTGGVLAMILTLPFGILIVVLFHVLNLVLSMQGAFIHSLRLNYLESFGRYYRGGGRPFLPLRREGTHYRFEQ
jgi:V/A-type H+-transporting ATPase subunit I